MRALLSTPKSIGSTGLLVIVGPTPNPEIGPAARSVVPRDSSCRSYWQLFPATKAVNGRAAGRQALPLTAAGSGKHGFAVTGRFLFRTPTFAVAVHDYPKIPTDHVLRADSKIALAAWSRLVEAQSPRADFYPC